MESAGLHIVDWIIFAVMLLLSTGIGRFLAMFFMSKLKLLISIFFYLIPKLAIVVLGVHYEPLNSN